MSSYTSKTVRGLKILNKRHKAMRAIADQAYFPEIHGDKVWFSSYFIMDYLKEHPLPKNAKVMEIGCGWGLLSIFCAKEFGSRVTATDADKNVFPYLNIHAEENGVKNITTKICRYENIKPKALQGVKAILGAEVCFWDELVDPLFRLIKRAVKNKVKTIIIADPGRPPFLALAERCEEKFGAELLDVSIKSPIKKEGYLLVIKN